MLNWNEIVQKYISKHSNQIKKVTQPLSDHFGIGYFTYHRIDNEGKYTVLVDRPEWAEHYVNEKIFLNDPYLRHPSVYQSGIALIDSHGTEEYKEMVIKAGKKVLNMDMGAILIQKNAHYVEFFGFSGGKETSALESLYINHPQLLKSFAAHFKKQMSPLLRQMEEEAASLIDLKGKDFLCDQLIYPSIDLDQRLAFCKDIGMHDVLAKTEKLTFRERQCLKLLIEDKSAKETAVLLKLSPRTVESYIENIKNKFGCWYKPEVLSIARQLDELGIL